MKRMYITFVFGMLVFAGFLVLALQDDVTPSSSNEESPSVATAPGAPEGTSPAPQETGGGGFSQVSEQETPSVEIYPEQQRLIGVKTVEVAMRNLRRTIRTVGRVELDERKLTTVNIKYEGWVERLYADYAGKYVQKGEPLAEIWSPEALAIQLEYVNLLYWQETQIPRYQRVIEFEWGDRYGTNGKLITYDPEPLFIVARQKFMLWGFTDDQVKAIEKNKKPLETITLRSPVTGFVFQKPAFEGTRVSPGDKLFDIVDLSTVWVLADLYEYELPLVKEGQEARITLSYFPGKTFDSKVDFIYPTLSGQTRTVKARFIIENPGYVLKPQMFANVEMEIDLGKRLAIPREALLDTGLRQVVYVDRGEGYYQPRQVKLGVRTDKAVEVMAGLRPGERVASRPVFLIDSEAKLKGIVQ